MAAIVLRAGPRRGREGRRSGDVFVFRDHLTFLDLVMPQEQRRDRAPGRRATSSRRAGGVREAAGDQALRRGRPRGRLGLRGDLPQQGPRGARAARPARHRHRLAHAHGGRARLLRVRRRARPTWSTPGSRTTCASRCPKPCRSGPRRGSRRDVSAKDVMLAHPRASRSSRAARGSARSSSSRGEAVAALAVDERATLTNMAVEVGGFTGHHRGRRGAVDYLVDAARPAARGRRAAVRRTRRRTPARVLARRSTIDAARARADGGDARRSAQRLCARRARRARRRSTSRTAARAPAARRPTWTCTRASCRDAVEQGQARRDGRALLHPVRLAGHPPLRRGAGLPRRLRAGGRGARRPVVRRVHQGGPRRVDARRTR